MRSRLKLRHLGLAIALAGLMLGTAGKAEAGLITYIFDETGGTVGGLITFNTPTPITSASEVVTFEILDSKLGPVGTYNIGGVVVVPPISGSGGDLTGGVYAAFNSTPVSATTVISPIHGASVLIGAAGTATGTWVTSVSAVPEPSTLALGFVGALGSFGFALRRWRKSAMQLLA